MRYPDTFLETLKMRNDIVSVMEPYAELKRSGRDYICLCPFHSERTPSCHIYTGSQHFYCFGCGAGGDVITFIRLMEHLDYRESVKFLADRAGMAMPEEDSGAPSRRIRLLEINREAARHYRDILLSPKGKEGLDYLAKRGLVPNTIRKYGLGYAPEGRQELRLYLKSKGYTDDELIAAALIVDRGKGLRDKFFQRVMFPIIDTRGNVIAFGGRALDPDAPAKYLNSDETLVFHKRENLFSLNFAKNTKEDFFILCEGYMDVITLNQAGFDCAVATLGTSITAEQAKLIKQNKPNVVISYDSDAAGQKAAVRAINLFGEAGVAARVLKIPDAKDPDEYIKNFGAESFRKILDSSEDALSYEFSKLDAGIKPETPAQKAAYLKKAVAFLAQIRNDTERTVYISEAAKLSGQPASVITGLVRDRIGYDRSSSERAAEKKLIRSVPARDPINPEAAQFPAEEKAESGIIAYMFHSPDKLAYIEKKLKPEDFPTSFNRRLFVFLSERIKNGESIDISAIGSEFTAEETGRITGICSRADALPYSIPRLDEYIKKLLERSQKAQERPVTELSDEEMLRREEEIRKRKRKDD